MLKSIRAFTLIELLIVVMIVGILATIGVPQLGKSLERARGTDARTGLAQIYRAELDYSGLRGGVFTDSIGDLIDVSLNQRYWTFVITTPTPTTFTATATRITGGWSSQTMSIDQTGTVTGNWEFI